jgi:hypothetical protein
MAFVLTLTSLLRHSQERMTSLGTLKNVGYCILPYVLASSTERLKRYQVNDCMPNGTDFFREATGVLV